MSNRHAKVIHKIIPKVSEQLNCSFSIIGLVSEASSYKFSFWS